MGYTDLLPFVLSGVLRIGLMLSWFALVCLVVVCQHAIHSVHRIVLEEAEIAVLKILELQEWALTNDTFVCCRVLLSCFPISRIKQGNDCAGE